MKKTTSQIPELEVLNKSRDGGLGTGFAESRVRLCSFLAARFVGVTITALGLLIAGGESEIWPWSVLIGILLFVFGLLLLRGIEEARIRSTARAPWRISNGRGARHRGARLRPEYRAW
ncbi:MAG: hypothetical protein ACOWWM_09585 [Desulfobacterales bacterium]